MSKLAKVIRDNIIRMLAERGINQEELHRRTGISPARVSTLLHGESELRSDTIQRIADAISVSTNDIVVARDDQQTEET